jgi:outer membrane protein TolC
MPSETLHTYQVRVARTTGLVHHEQARVVRLRAELRDAEAALAEAEHLRAQAQADLDTFVGASHGCL